MASPPCIESLVCLLRPPPSHSGCQYCMPTSILPHPLPLDILFCTSNILANGNIQCSLFSRSCLIASRAFAKYFHKFRIVWDNNLTVLYLLSSHRIRCASPILQFILLVYIVGGINFFSLPFNLLSYFTHLLRTVAFFFGAFLATHPVVILYFH